MTDKNKDSVTIVVPGTLTEIHTRPRRLAPFFDLIATLASFLPSVPTDERGEKNRVQIKVALVIIGLALVIASDRNIIIIISGFLMMASSYKLPFIPSDKRALLQKLKDLQSHHDITYIPAFIRHDGRRLELWRGKDDGDSNRIRRVLTNRAFTLLEKREDDLLWIGLSPQHSKKKRDTIWFATANQSKKTQSLQLFNPDRSDHPIFLKNSEHSRALLKRLRTLHENPKAIEPERSISDENK